MNELNSSRRKVGFVSNESSGTRKSQTTSDIHSMLVNHLYAFFFTFRKTGRVKLQGFTDLLAPIKTDRFTTRYYIYVYDNLGNIRRRWYQIGEATSSSSQAIPLADI